MKFLSTRNDTHRVDLSEAILDGLAPDGGLYVPSDLPVIGEDYPPLGDASYELVDVAEYVLAPFFEGDELEGFLGDICWETFDFPVPRRPLDDATSVLELFHGPTAAFKDVGARFLARSMSRLNRGADEPLTILVATSGDTGAAVAAAFEGQPNVEVVVLYPTGKVSERQEQLLTCWGENVRTFGVDGNFDDCQRIVKSAFRDERWRREKRLSSANSINVGRLLPQITYYATAALNVKREHGVRPTFVVPTGNAGNVLGCVYARQMGFPVGEIVMATNENRPITKYFETGDWQAYPTEHTLASAMDVGDPSNFERLRHLWPDVERVRRELSAETVDDAAIESVIKRQPFEQLWDPHTACAVEVRERMEREGRLPAHAVMVATAHPAKFPDVVEPLVGREVGVPPRMAEFLERPTHVETIEPTLEAFSDAVLGRGA